MLTNGHTTASPTTIRLIETRFVPRTSLQTLTSFARSIQFRCQSNRSKC